MSTTDASTPPPADASQAGTVNGDRVAPPGTYYRRARYIMAALLVAGGLWFAYDGYKAWPAHNAHVADIERQIADAQQAGDEDKATALKVELSKLRKPYSGNDIFLQRLLAWTLPPAGLALLAWTLYNSRGQYRLSGTTLHVPGHPPVALDEITRIDKRLWDRKGIAYLDYTTAADNRSGRIRLDDFVYDRKPTDAIFARVEAHVTPAAAPEAEAADEARNPNPEIRNKSE